MPSTRIGPASRPATWRKRLFAASSSAARKDETLPARPNPSRTADQQRRRERVHTADPEKAPDGDGDHGRGGERSSGERDDPGGGVPESFHAGSIGPRAPRPYPPKS